MESDQIRLQKNEFWKDHILKAKEFSGSDIEYCLANGLSKGIFYIYKKRLGFTRPPKSERSTFVRVAPAPERSEKPPKVEESRLPDPKWLAQFLVALLGKR